MYIFYRPIYLDYKICILLYIPHLGIFFLQFIMPIKREVLVISIILGVLHMTKMDVINNICVDMMGTIDMEEVSKLKNVLLFRLSGFELQESKQLPSTEIHDNEYILQRFAIDSIARGIKKSSIKAYMSVLRKFFDDIDKNYTDVTGQDIVDYIAFRQYRDKISNTYKVTIYRYFRVFFSWAYRKKHIANDVMLEVDPVKQTQKKKIRLSDDEVARCRKCVQGDLFDSAFLELMLTTGGRVGELRNLKLSDLDFQNRTITIWGEKSSKERVVFMTPTFVVVAKEYIGNRTDGYFLSLRDGKMVSKQTLETRARTIANNAGAQVNATVHVYRKTFASIMLRKTKDVLLVSKLLGHASPDTTAKFYLVDDIENMKNEVLRTS